MRTSLCLDLHRVGLAQWFPTRDDLAPLGHLKYLEIFYDSGKGATGIK